MRVLFITSASCEGPLNQNHFQRIAILSEWAKLTILARRGASFPIARQKGAEVIPARLWGRPGVLLESLLLALGSRDNVFDLVLTDPSVLGICGALIKLLARSKWVVDVWDIPIRNQSRSLHGKVRAHLVRRLVRRAYRYADHFVVSILPDDQLRWFDIPAGKISAFTNAVWRESATSHEEPNEEPVKGREIFCSRSLHTEDMGLDTLAYAFNIITRHFPDAHLTIVGRIPDEVKSQLSPVLGLPNVELINHLQHDRLLRRIATAAVCVVPFKNVPDLAQTYPIKVLEYMSLGKPIVASNIRGMAQLITHDHNGLLFRAGDVEDLADKLCELFISPSLCQRLGENARNLAPRYDARVKGKEVLALLQRISGTEPT